jgi:predicted GNAT family acetyltransferase
MIAGELGKADHVEALTALLGEFQRAVSIPASRPKSQPELVAWARELLAERGVLFWETADGALVAVLHLSPGPLVERVGIVVTRDSCRRRGYGGALVYAATRRVFEELKKPLAALFADAENPDSNSLYSKLGYVVVNECRLIELRRADGGEPRSKEV